MARENNRGAQAFSGSSNFACIRSGLIKESASS